MGPLWSGTKWPVNDVRAIQRKPDQHRLEDEPRPMVPPAAWETWNMDPLDSMLDVGRQNTKRIESQHQACGAAQLRGQERNRAGDLTRSGDLHDEARLRHPAWHDQKKPIGLCEVGKACHAIERSQGPPYRRPGSVCDVPSPLGQPNRQGRPCCTTPLPEPEVSSRASARCRSHG